MKSKGNSELIIKSLQFDTFYGSKIGPCNLSSRFNYFTLMESLQIAVGEDIDPKKG